MRPDFKGYGRVEPLLEKHIPKFDKSLSQKMLIEANALETQIQRFVIPIEPKSFTIKDMHGETAYWTISFTLPVIQYVPECFRHLTTNEWYHAEKGQRLEHVPSYIPNINHVALLARYNGGDAEFGNNTDGLFNEYVYEKNTPMELNSLNILLQWYSKKNFFDESLHDYFKKCFEFCFWRLPTFSYQDDGSCINNLIYATSSRVLDVIRLRKTLVKILNVDKRTEKITLLGKHLPGKFAQVLILCDDGEKLGSEKKYVFLLEQVADSIKEGDILNAVLASPHGKNFKTTFLLGKIGKVVEPGNIQCILSILLSKIMQNLEDNSSPTKIASKNKIQFELTNIINANNNVFEGIFGWGKDIPKKVSLSIQNMFPLFLEDGESVYHMSPVIMAFLSTLAPQIIQQKDSLILIMKLFDTMKVNSKFWGREAMMRLRTSDNYERIQGELSSFANRLLEKSPRLVNRIVYSRILSQHYTYWS